MAVLLLFGLLLKLPLFLHPKNIIASQIDGRLYQWLISLLPPGNAASYSLIAFILLYTQSLMINYLVNDYQSNLPAGDGLYLNDLIIA